MFTIEDIYKEKNNHPDISFLEILVSFQEKFEIPDEELLQFIRKNKTFYGELQRECVARRLVKKQKITPTLSLDKIFGG